MLLGIDTGGTFTDFVLYFDDKIIIHKVLSTPESPEKAILFGIQDLKSALKLKSQTELDNFDSSLTIVHGSTVATNAVLERKGVRTVYVANKGLGDVLTIARQTRPELYSMQGSVVPPPVTKELCLEANSRVSSKGEVLDSLSTQQCEDLSHKIMALQPEAVAINFLFSYLNSEDEIKLLEKLPSSVFVSCSSSVLPELKEYERGIATWLNSYVGPLVKGYVQRLQDTLPQASISVMQSSGGTIDATQAGEQAVRMLLSGPAGGMAGAKYMADITACVGLLTFDMGGTSTDVAMIDHEIKLTSEGRIGEFPVAVPMVDMHTIGAGGGSIAYVDSGGLLQVGPESAGADPGPACYGHNGRYATVTDANLVLGRILESEFLGGSMKLDCAAATTVIQNLADSLSLELFETASGIITLANEHMAQALRVMSVQRGLDPKLLTLVSFGGAGGLHVCALADSLSMSKAMVPIHGGVLSAFGMLVAPKARYLSHSYSCIFNTINIDKLVHEFTLLQQQGFRELEREAVLEHEIECMQEIDLRYSGQSSVITVAVNVAINSSGSNPNLTDLQPALNSFHEQHQLNYGHQMDLPVEIVNIRLTLKSVRIPQMSHAISNSVRSMSNDKVKVHGFSNAVIVHQRTSLKMGQVIKGPAIIIEKTSTTLLESSWQARVVAMGNLMLTKIN